MKLGNSVKDRTIKIARFNNLKRITRGKIIFGGFKFPFYRTYFFYEYQTMFTNEQQRVFAKEMEMNDSGSLEKFIQAPTVGFD